MNRFLSRIDSLRTLLVKNDIDALFINHSPNVSYFTGKAGDDCYLYITDSSAFIITDFRYKEMALELSDCFELVCLDSNSDIISFISERKEKRLGIEKDHFPLNFYFSLCEKRKKRRIVPVSGIVEELRQIKDDFEIEATKKACEIADFAFSKICSFLRAGISEKTAAAELEYYMKQQGASDFSFKTILISGSKTSYPHGAPSDKLIENGDFVTMDFGCIHSGYCSDMTRTVAIGSAAPEMRDIYGIVLKAQLNACENIRAGLSGKECDAFARDIIVDAGYGEYFGHSLGHGTGLEIHEAPRLSPYFDSILPENSIISIEPGIYMPGKFGIRIEDLAVLKNNGIMNLVTSPKELIIL